MVGSVTELDTGVVCARAPVGVGESSRVILQLAQFVVAGSGASFRLERSS
jgi:hypothetical protein